MHGKIPLPSKTRWILLKRGLPRKGHPSPNFALIIAFGEVGKGFKAFLGFIVQT